MQIDKARRVRDLAQEVVRLIDAATARAHRDREATNEYYYSVGLDPLPGPPDLAYTRMITEALVERGARAMYTASLADAGSHRDTWDDLPAYWRAVLTT